MLPIRIVAVVAALFLPASVFAQEWTEYVDRTERFSVNFPGQPTIRETTYQPQRGAPLPARVFTVQDGSRRYSLTVVNLADHQPRRYLLTPTNDSVRERYHQFSR